MTGKLLNAIFKTVLYVTEFVLAMYFAILATTLTILYNNNLFQLLWIGELIFFPFGILFIVKSEKLYKMRRV